MRTKTCYVCSLNKWVVTLILKLNEGIVSNLVKFEYQRSSSQIKQFLKERKKHDFLSPLYKVRQHSELEVEFMLKYDQAGGRRGANLPPKGPQTQLTPGRGQINYDNDDYEDDDDDVDDFDDYDLFSSSQRTSNINYDNDDYNHNDDNDDYDLFSSSQRTSNINYDNDDYNHNDDNDDDDNNDNDDSYDNDDNDEGIGI